MTFKNDLKKAAIIGGLMLAGGVSSESNFNVNPELNKKEIYYEKLSNFLNRQSEIYAVLDLEKRLKEERENLSKPLDLSPDQLNEYIKQAYNNVKKWPKEFDKRLFRLLIRQESKYNAHAISKSGYMGLGQNGTEVIQTLRPEEYKKMINPDTGEIDSLSVKRYLFDPVKNLELSLEYLTYCSEFCSKRDPNWKESDLDTQRKKMLFCYNAGIGTAEKHGFDHRDKKEINGKRLKKENMDYPEDIMKAYYDQNVKVKI